jgi:hypothetical protein
MTTVNEHIRHELMSRLGLFDYDREHNWTSDEILVDANRKCRELDRVVQLAKNRLLMGSMRYGVDAARDYDNGREAIRRINRYFETGNTENLVDALNFCALEFNHPHVKDAFFEAEDDGEHAVSLVRR